MKSIIKKSIGVIAVAIMLASPMTSKSQAFEQGKNGFQIGYGFGNFIQAVFNSYDIYDELKIGIGGPMFVKYEYAVSDKIGFGLNIAYASAKVTYKDLDYTTSSGDIYEASINWSTLSFLARMNVHFGESDVIDPYWGVGMGYRTASWKFDDNDPDYGSESITNLMPIGFETTFGCRFMFASNFGAYVEVGFAKAIFQGGLALKF